MEDLIGVYGILDRDHWPERSVSAAGRRSGDRDGRNRMRFIMQSGERIPDG